MYKYHVKKRSRTRFTFRFLGGVIILISALQIVLFVMGYGRGYKIGNIFAFLLMLYGIYIFINSFRANAYDMDFEFNEDNFVVNTKWGKRTHKYGDVLDISQVIPENEMIYSILHITVDKKNYVIPFSYKKEVADTIYTYVNDRVIAEKLKDDIEEKDNLDNKEASEKTEGEA